MNVATKNVIALRVVDSQDGMTADWCRCHSICSANFQSYIKRVRGVNRVVYDISSKPRTIEWE